MNLSLLLLAVIVSANLYTTCEALLVKPYLKPVVQLNRAKTCFKNYGDNLRTIGLGSCVLRSTASTVPSTVATSIATEAVKPSLLKQLGPTLLSALCVAGLMYPLDLVRALQMANSGSAIKLSTVQLLSKFKETHGVQGFFTQGLAPELARSTWMRLLKFGLFPIIHEKVFGISEKVGSGITKAVAAILASIPEAVSIMPLEIAKISLQLDTEKRFKNSMFAAMKEVLQQKSIAGFAIGYLSIQARQALWTAGYFATIKYFEDLVNSAIQTINGEGFKLKEHKSWTVFSQLVSGFLAGVFGAILNTPFDTIRTTIQKRLLSPDPSQAQLATSLLGVASEIIGSRGISGLYSGFQFKAFHLGGGGALMAFFVPFFTKLFANM